MIHQQLYNYIERNPHMRMLFIFDKMDDYEVEAQNAVWEENYIYYRFDGKWINLKLRANREWQDKKVVLLLSNELRPDVEKMLTFHLTESNESISTITGMNRNVVNYQLKKLSKIINIERSGSNKKGKLEIITQMNMDKLLTYLYPPI